MQVFASTELARAAHPGDARLIHELYRNTPGYFEIISMPMPTEAEVKRELEAASGDERRFTELIFLPEDIAPASIPVGLSDEQTGRTVVGYLDYKLDYPEAGEGMVNLLLIHEGLQNLGLGRACVQDLEARLKGQVSRLLASIYGQNPRAEHFWTSLGYRFAIDAKPVMDWYAKDIG